jgi:hypothetical protein
VLRRIAIAAALLALVYAGYTYRRAFIRSFFAVGSGGGDPPALARPDDDAPPLPTVARTRVVLLDGVDLETALTLPGYSAVCDRGLDLIVDVGFPTVSLPVQRALWTGLTQQQSGHMFVLKKQPPHPESIPAQIRGSVAIADAHPEIIASLGFSLDLAFELRPMLEGAAIAAVASDAPLAFVHLLGADYAGHKKGRDSDAFRAAARDADATLGRLLAADPGRDRGDTRWLVVSDHGHRDAGGHGDAEPHIRRVRACIAGALEKTLADSLRARDRPAIHLVDLARAIADSTGARLPSDSAGRPLAAAIAAPLPETGALPSPSLPRWIAALIAVALGLVATAWAARGLLVALPWWWPIAYLSVVAIEQAPTLSVPMVYPPLGRAMYTAALPGLCALAILATWSLRRLPPLRVAIAELALPLAAIIAALVLCGAGTGDPPLMPYWTARASLYLVLGFTGAAVVALVALASAFLPGSDRTTRSETRGSEP